MYNDNYRYIHSVIDVFSKYLHPITTKTKSGPSVALAFRSIFNDPKYSTGFRPKLVRTDRSKEFLNKYFQEILRNTRWGHSVSGVRNTDLKCVVLERMHRTIRDCL